jgi:hypothetical protein
MGVLFLLQEHSLPAVAALYDMNGQTRHEEAWILREYGSPCLKEDGGKYINKGL